MLEFFINHIYKGETIEERMGFNDAKLGFIVLSKNENYIKGYNKYYNNIVSQGEN